MDFTPKSIFKGTNSDGTTFKVNEWSPDSIGNLDMSPMIPMLVFWCCLMAVASPIMLLLSLVYYRGLLQLSSIIGIIVGGIFLCCAYFTWLPFLFLMIFFTEDVMNFMIVMTIATMIGNGILLTLSFIIKGKYNKWFAILLTILGVLVSFSNWTEKIKTHNFYEYQNNRD